MKGKTYTAAFKETLQKAILAFCSAPVHPITGQHGNAINQRFLKAKIGLEAIRELKTLNELGQDYGIQLMRVQP